jgi:protein required for attachment to host cells
MSHRHVARHSPRTWVVVADRARARIFSSLWPLGDELIEVDDLVDETSRLRGTETYSDAPTAFVSGGCHHHRGEPANDLAHQTAERFAKRIADRLDRGRQDDAFGKLILVAPPVVLGELRCALPLTVTRLVVKEIHQDFVEMTRNQIAEHIAARMVDPLASTTG